MLYFWYLYNEYILYPVFLRYTDHSTPPWSDSVEITNNDKLG